MSKVFDFRHYVEWYNIGTDELYQPKAPLKEH